MQPLHLHPEPAPHVYYRLEEHPRHENACEMKEENRELREESNAYETERANVYTMLSSQETLVPLEPMTRAWVEKTEVEVVEEDMKQRLLNPYAWDMTQYQSGYECHREKTNLDLFIPHVSPVPDEIIEDLTVKFASSVWCPTPLLRDLNPLATIRGPKYLAHKHPHEWDQRIIFVEEPHAYFIDGSAENIMSATKLISCFFPEFNSESQALQTLNSKTFADTNHRKTYKYYGCKTQQDIIDRWSHWSNLGTQLHANIESYLNEEPFSILEENHEPFRQFQKVWQDENFKNWTNYRTEMSIFDPETRVAGQIDFVGMIDPVLKHVVLIDWKRCGSIGDCCFNRFKGLPPTMGAGCCSDIENSKFAKYSLQLNLYKYILEKNYGLYVKKMLIMQFHPDLKKHGAAVYKVANFQKNIELMMATRKLAIQKFGENTMQH